MKRKPTSKKYLKFVELLERFRPWMEAERLTMSEVDFITKYETSRITMLKLMWPCPRKEKISKPLRKPLPVEEINELRLTMSDVEIAEQYGTYQDNIVKQCGSRKSLGIKQVSYRKDKYKTRSVIKHNEERELKTDRWEYPKQTDYELEWQKEAIDMNRPHQSIYSKIWVDLSVKKV